MIVDEETADDCTYLFTSLHAIAGFLAAVNTVTTGKPGHFQVTHGEVHEDPSTAWLHDLGDSQSL